MTELEEFRPSLRRLGAQIVMFIGALAFGILVPDLNGATRAFFLAVSFLGLAVLILGLRMRVTISTDVVDVRYLFRTRSHAQGSAFYRIRNTPLPIGKARQILYLRQTAEGRERGVPLDMFLPQAAKELSAGVHRVLASEAKMDAKSKQRRT